MRAARRPHWRFPLLSSQGASTFIPEGGAQQGRKDSNLRHAVLEAAVLAAELRPYGVVQKETARQGFLGAVSACGLAVGYMSGTVPLVASSIDWHGT